MTDARFLLLSRLVLAIFFIGFYGFIVLKVIGMTAEFPSSVEKVILFLLGALTTSVVSVVGFFFTSSQSSAEKNLLLQAAQRPPGDDQ